MQEVEAEPSQKSLQGKPNKPKSDDQRKKKPQTKKMHQNAAERDNGTPLASEHHGLTVVSTTGRGGCHGRGAPSSPQLLWFSATLCFPTRLFFGLCYALPLKRRMYLALWRDRIYRLASPSLSKTPSKKKEEEEGW